jgi:hypothetical protein
MRVPEKIGELLVLPVLARGPVAIFDEIDSRYVGEIFEFRQAHEIKRTVGKGARQKRSFSEFTEHSSRSALGAAYRIVSEIRFQIAIQNPGRVCGKPRRAN